MFGRDTEKYITFSLPIKKGLDNGKSVTYKIKFIDSFRFMSSSFYQIIIKVCKSCLDYMSVKDDQLVFSCFEGKNNHKKDFKKEFIKRFANLYEFCNEIINKFIVLLRKGVYPYEYMDSWGRFDETLLPDKGAL